MPRLLRSTRGCARCETAPSALPLSPRYTRDHSRCGIVGHVGGKECAPILVEGLRRLEYRGYASAGLALHTGRGIELLRAVGKLSNLEAALKKSPLAGTTGIGHTRWATHGRPSDANTHPHVAGGAAVVHNGIIENHVALLRALERQDDTI